MKTVKVRLLRMVVFFPLLFLVPFFSFCDAAYGAEKVVLQLRWDHQFQFAGYYAAVWQGYYREAGLDVEIRSAITPEHKILRAVEEVAEGRADFGVGAADILVARDKGAPLVLLAVIFQQSAARFYALEKTDLNSPADLLRLRVARNVNDLIDVELQAMLRAEGIDPTKVKAYPHQPGIDHLVDGRVDVIPGYSTTMPYYGERRGGVRLVSLAPSSYGVDFYGDSLFTHERLVKTRPEMVEKFKEASLRGWRYALENPKIIADRIAGELPRLDTVEDIRAFNRFQIDHVTELTLHPLVELGHVNEERWQRMQKTLRESGIVRGTLDPAVFFYNPDRQKRERLQKLWRVILPVAVILLLVAATSLFWNRRLRITIRQRNDALAERKRSEERYHGLLEHSPFGVVVVGDHGNFSYLNPKFRELFGYDLADVPDRRTWLTKAHPDPEYRKKVVAAWREYVKDVAPGERTPRLFNIACKDGTQKVAHIMTVKLESGEYLVTFEDRTELHRYQENLEYFALHDALTGLLNRRSLEDMLNRTIARAKRGTASSLVYMDLDNFKDVNDTIGHAAGDEVLITLTGLLRAELRTEDVVFRLGGDEFAILLDGIDCKEALPAAERLRAIVAAHRFELKGRVFPLSLSIGLIEIEGALATGELLSQADAAMYRAKEQGKNRVVMA